MRTTSQGRRKLVVEPVAFGTVRVIGLGICLAAVAVTRYLRATTAPPGQAAAVAENTDAAA